jgi:argininosuccinate lyase
MARLAIVWMLWLAGVWGQTPKLWGGRFEGAPSQVFEQFSGSLHFDRRLFDADIQGSIAWVRALEKAKIVGPSEAAQLLRGFEAVRAAAAKPGFFDAKDEDVHTLVIRELKERAGPVADKIHTGRSRNEQVSLDTRLWLRGEIDAVRRELAAVQASLLAQARKHPNAIIPGFTHTRRAQPVLWAHYLLAYFEMFARDQERLAEVRRRVNLMPMGSGALAGAGFPYDREGMARELGFDGLTRNSMDVSADRDFVQDFLHAASLSMLHLSRLSEDWILYSSDEFAWLELSDQVTSGSSLMPQKKNPDSLELIRGKAGRVYGAATALYITLKGLPLTYNRDMQEDKEPLFDAVDQWRASLAMMKNVVDTAALKPERARQAVEESWCVATDLAEELARQGVPFHQAHQLVGKLVLTSIRAGKRPAQWSGAELAAFDARFKPEMVRLMNPAEGLKTRNLAGGTGPEAVSKALAEASRRLAQ